MGFRGKECIEDAVNVFRINPDSRIFYNDDHMIGFVNFRFYSQYTRAIHNRTHRVNSIRDQVHDDLLYLHAIGRNFWQCLGQLALY